MMIGALIPMEWAFFFTACVGLAVLFIVIRKTVFYLSERFSGFGPRFFLCSELAAPGACAMMGVDYS